MVQLNSRYNGGLGEIYRPEERGAYVRSLMRERPRMVAYTSEGEREGSYVRDHTDGLEYEKEAGQRYRIRKGGGGSSGAAPIFSGSCCGLN